MSNTSWKARLLGIALGLAPVFAVAAGVYTGTAPVATQSDRDRATALRAALGQAVTQAAKGDAGVLKRPDVARALTRAERYARSYSYQPNPAPNSDPKKATPKFLLVVAFDAAQIDALVREPSAAPASAAAAAGAAAASGATSASPATAASMPTNADSSAPAPNAAAVAASPGSYHLWFSGLRSAEDYARLVGALDSSPEVRALRVDQAHGNVLEAYIDARGSLQNLTDALAAARIAHATGTQPPVEGVDAVLDFEP
ncbi:MAG: DUF2066 domain-containing protein [Rudaea sp.]|uniref:DUF2066 domain-containing protein n=1 Tax=Rudaea sp. TaxID=2136325 RepID=UPI0039E2DD36